ncbi:DinB family protein [Vicingaceae bacterium]|nr:DinB family protein [Vicingaceae bacterium]
MSAAIDGLIFGWKKNLDYGPKLVADLSDEQMIFQPAGPDNPPANHPAWVFSHLNAYLPVIAGIIKSVEFEDPKNHRFGMLSRPENDLSVYDRKQDLVDQFVAGHDEVLQLLEKSSIDMLDQPVKLLRWEEIMPIAGIALPYLMLNHENGHLGQLSTWRRVQGMPSV